MRFALRRLGFFALTLWAALTLNFFLPRLMPGNPAVAMMGKFRGPVNPQALKALEAAFGVSTKEGLVGQYFALPGRRGHRELRHLAVLLPRSRWAGSSWTPSRGRSAWSG